MSDQDAKKKKKNAGKRKAPGLLSFVVWRQFFMVLAAPGVATTVGVLYPEQVQFMVVLVAAAVPALIHGQLWKWTYDWAGRGAAVMRNLRMGQIALGLVHVGIAGWSLSQVATGAVDWNAGAFYHGLTIAGLAAGIWETVRPVMELRDPPEVKEAAERKARRKAAKAKKAAEEAAQAAEQGDEAGTGGDEDAITEGTENVEDPATESDAPTATDSPSPVDEKA